MRLNCQQPSRIATEASRFKKRKSKIKRIEIYDTVVSIAMSSSKRKSSNNMLAEASWKPYNISNQFSD